MPKLNDVQKRKTHSRFLCNIRMLAMNGWLPTEIFAQRPADMVTSTTSCVRRRHMRRRATARLELCIQEAMAWVSDV